MDIHRCRFVPYQPQSINSVAFSHSSNTKQKSPKDLRLAIGRANGDVEIWNPNHGAWVQQRIFRGSFGRTIEQVQWTQDLVVTDESVEQRSFQRASSRLFSTGGAASVTEWDVEKGIPKVHADSNSADVWCFAPQPQWTDVQQRNQTALAAGSPSQLLAAGCADGSIVLFSTADDELRFDRVLARPHSNKSRCISITWRDRNTVVAGFEESVIRVIDIRNKQTLRTITLGKSRETSKPLVWTVKCLPNGTILSGDSSGELKIWDAQNYSLLQRLKTHNADVLDITTNVAGTTILTVGVDRRTVAYAPQPGLGNSKVQRWAEVRHRRFHEHDVKVITAYESKTLNIAVSGGLDTVPVVLPLKNWNTDYHRSLPYLPQRPQLSAAPQTRLMLTWWARDLFIWQLPPRYKEPSDSDSVSEDQSNHQLLAQIQLQDDEYINSAQMSNSGNMIVAATNTGVKLFQLRRAISPAEIKSRPVELPRMIANQGASHVGFSPDGRWLYAIRLNNVVTMVKMFPAKSAKEKPDMHETVTKLDRKARATQAIKGSYASKLDRTISAVTFSSDSRILAVADNSGAIDTWILEGHEVSAQDHDMQDKEDAESSADESDSDSDSDDETDSRAVDGQKWIRTPAGSQLPSLESAVLTIAFKPSAAKPISPGNVHGNEGLHVTRHNHHPISPESPAAECGMLFAVTANHQIVEFDVTNCRLSDWSRRNPSSVLPERFRLIKDRVMGIWFDCRPEAGIDRLWLYGSTFIYMFDLTKDLVHTRRQSESALVKVGRLGKHVLEASEDHAIVLAEQDNKEMSSSRLKKRKRNDGAGDEMDAEQKYTSSVRIHREIESGDDNDEDAGTGLLSPPSSQKQEDSDEEVDGDMDIDEDSDAPDDNLLALRRGKTTSGQDEHSSQSKDAGPASWHTFQYRGIYGACALQSLAEDKDGDENSDSAIPEVVIVERSLYDVEMIPRFSGQIW